MGDEGVGTGGSESKAMEGVVVEGSVGVSKDVHDVVVTSVVGEDIKENVEGTRAESIKGVEGVEAAKGVQGVVSASAGVKGVEGASETRIVESDVTMTVEGVDVEGSRDVVGESIVNVAREVVVEEETVGKEAHDKEPSVEKTIGGEEARSEEPTTDKKDSEAPEDEPTVVQEQEVQEVSSSEESPPR